MWQCLPATLWATCITLPLKPEHGVIMAEIGKSVLPNPSRTLQKGRNERLLIRLTDRLGRSKMSEKLNKLGTFVENAANYFQSKLNKVRWACFSFVQLPKTPRWNMFIS